MGETADFSERELDVMSVLWDAGSGTVAEIRERLSDELGYTSVLKVLQILEKKGAVRHETEGRAYRYFPVVEQDEAGRTALGRVLEKIYHGSAELLLARLVSDRALDADELGRMREILDRASEDRAAEEAEEPDPPEAHGAAGPDAAEGDGTPSEAEHGPANEEEP